MSQPADQPSEAKPLEASEALALGDFYEIGLVGKKLVLPDKPGGVIYAKVYDGFLKQNGYRHFVNRSTGCTDEDPALKFVENTLIPQLQDAWDNRAAVLKVTREQLRSKKSANVPAPKGSLEDAVMSVLDMWEERNVYDLQVFRGRKYAACQFLKALGDKARQPSYEPIEDDCLEALGKMLETYDKDKGGAAQAVRELKYVLKRVERFPAKLVCKLKAPKCNAKIREAAKDDFPLTPAERVIIWNNLPKADRETRGILLVLMNSSQHGIDVANLTVKKFREACQDICVNERCKTETSFRMVAWTETRQWCADRKYDDADIYAFEVVYTKKELKTPGRNRIPLDETPQQAEKRRAAASQRAAALVKAYLVEICGITRPGVSMHSFRYTNVSEWEAEGFARVACMACSGHLTEENYVKYASPIYEHIKSISNTTHDFWRHADQERVRIFTKNQLYDALVVAMQAESEKIIKEMAGQHAAQTETMRDAHESQKAALREAHITQMSLMRDLYAAQMSAMRTHHDVQNAKLDQIICLLGAWIGIFFNAPALLKRALSSFCGGGRHSPPDSPAKLLKQPEITIN